MVDGQAKTLLVMLLAVVVATVGDLCMAQGMRQVGQVAVGGASDLWRIGARIVTTPRIWVAVTMSLTFFALWLTALSWADLSFVLPITALTYVLNAMLVAPVLGERVSPLRWAGTWLIFLGVLLVTLSGQGSGPVAP